MDARTPDSEAPLREMREAIGQARQRPVAVMESVAGSKTREDAAAALAALLEIDSAVSDELLDLRISEFVGKLPNR